MRDEFRNVYDDARRASAYATLEFPGTYSLAFRDLPELVARHVAGQRALDFGCGTGRSTRFLRGLGFNVTGVDVSHPMLEQARALDPGGDYRLVGHGDLSGLQGGTFDLILSAFTFDNIATRGQKGTALAALKRLLAVNGRVVNVVSSPAIYVHEWASFTTKDFPSNHEARSGDRVYIVMVDVPDRRPVEDVLCTDDDYADLYRLAGLSVVEVLRPLAQGTEPIQWKSETAVAPWVIYVLAAA
jgi:ubiquinone/menaquinone biosynthesis C-methylase UbiE